MATKELNAAQKYYLKNKEKKKAYNREWVKANPERAAASRKKAMKKFLTNKRERFNELILRNYYKNKRQWMIRRRTNYMLKQANKPLLIKYQCLHCESKENLQLKFNTYPENSLGIREAVIKGDIFYVCKECKGKK